MKIYPYLDLNFRSKKIENFTKMDLVLAILHGETLEEFALRHNCSLGTVKRRKSEWGITLQRSPKFIPRIEIPMEDLLRSNDPAIKPEEICVDNDCSKTTLNRRKKEANVPKRVPQLTQNLSNDDFESIYSGNIKVSDYLAQNKSKISKSTFYRKLAKSNISTPRKESRAILKNLDINLVKQMRDEGKFYKEIADYFHVSEDRLRKNLKKQL